MVRVHPPDLMMLAEGGKSMSETTPDPVPIQNAYANWQLARALIRADSESDPEARQRALAKVESWGLAIHGMLMNRLTPGQRTPITGAPVWATPEVLTGGFVSGRLLASGPLLSHEQGLLSELGFDSSAQARVLLNRYFLSEAGLSRLQNLLSSGCYRIDVPEEGALLTVAWLVQKGQAESARELTDQLVPWFEQLRFYPRLTEQSRHFGKDVFRMNIGQVRKRLAARKPKMPLEAQREAVNIWAPLYDEALGLLIETVTGDLPSLQTDQNGYWQRDADGRFPVIGGWPCQHYPPGWGKRVEDFLKRYDSLRQQHSLCGRPDRLKDSFASLRSGLRKAAEQPKSLTGREVGRLRMILARSLNRRGLPDSERCYTLRQAQQKQLVGPAHYLIAKQLSQRLEAFPDGEGLEQNEQFQQLDQVLQPVSLAGYDQTVLIPYNLRHQLQFCVRASIDTLIRQGIVTSGDSLAELLPQIVGALRAEAYTDPDLRRLYISLYEAFRRRRSLLLLHLQKQVQLQELPWLAALEAAADRKVADIGQLNRVAMAGLVELTLRHFPAAILPNKLLQELSALAGESKAFPLVEELAADIFMGQFSPKFVRAALIAADLLEGRLYSHYYAINWDDVWTLGQVSDEQLRCRKFAQLCQARSGLKTSPSRPAENGKVIEQQQILTTQNLAVLYVGLDLQSRLDPPLLTWLAQTCFSWICKRQQMPVARHHDVLIRHKQTAYAWRQMIFYLSCLPKEKLPAFTKWSQGHVSKQAEAFQARFAPVMQGLHQASMGQALAPEAMFLAWSPPADKPADNPN